MAVKKQAPKKQVLKKPPPKTPPRKKAAPTKPKHLAIEVFREEARLADLARARARILRGTVAAADATRTNARRPRAMARAVSRPTTGFDPLDAAGNRLTGAVRTQPARDRLCVANATATAIEALASRTADSVDNLPTLSARHIFDLSGKQESLSPTALGVAGGVLEDACFPRTTACDDPEKHRWRAGMQRLDAIDDPVIEMCAALRNGALLVISVPIFDNFADFTGPTVFKPSGREIGAHALCIVGYSVDPAAVAWIVQNSYGPTWGDNGYARIAWEDKHMQAERVVYTVQGLVPPGP